MQGHCSTVTTLLEAWFSLRNGLFSLHGLALSPPASTPAFSFSPGFLFTQMQPKQPAISPHCNTTEATLLVPATLMISLTCCLSLRGSDFTFSPFVSSLLPYVQGVLIVGVNLFFSVNVID